MMLAIGAILGLCLHHVSSQLANPILYPRPSETRDVVSLDGVWDFSLSPQNEPNKGLEENWYAGNLRQLSGTTIQMPVPASYNDITEDKNIRDYVGVVWYERRFFVPDAWKDGRRVWIRFGSVCYAAQVINHYQIPISISVAGLFDIPLFLLSPSYSKSHWSNPCVLYRVSGPYVINVLGVLEWANGQSVTSHEIGHLPFEKEITQLLVFGGENVVTVAVNNTLLPTTVPQGSLGSLNVGNTTIVTQEYSFDFFNYAGIDRSVYLYTTPSVYITDIATLVALSSDNNQANISYTVAYAGNEITSVTCNITLVDKEGNEVVNLLGPCNGSLNIASPKLWWPYLMDPDPGYIYTLKAQIIVNASVRDTYRQPVGLRVVTWSNTTVFINGKKIYMRGFGKHEDSDIRGKGLDLSLIIKDYGLIKWIGANAYRTSHYPYAEEIMDLADKYGIMIIDECPSVNTDIFSSDLKTNHQRSLSELIKRDQNHPSVIMWSVANEPRTAQAAAGPYFRDIVAHVKTLDTSRPVTIAMSSTPQEDYAGEFLDVVAFNRYNAWYSDYGRTEIIADNVVAEADNWFKRYNKPILMTEYGADCYAGVHSLPETMWSEEYQTEVLMRHFEAFDILRSRGYFVGEMIWNFADFQTAQTITRVKGNKKGIFTRQRDPKAAAILLRQRYWELAEEENGVLKPKDIYGYTSKGSRKVEL